jgi:hypothetical protein
MGGVISGISSAIGFTSVRPIAFSSLPIWMDESGDTVSAFCQTVNFET